MTTLPSSVDEFYAALGAELIELAEKSGHNIKPTAQNCRKIVKALCKEASVKALLSPLLQVIETSLRCEPARRLHALSVGRSQHQRCFATLENNQSLELLFELFTGAQSLGKEPHRLQSYLETYRDFLKEQGI